MCGRFAVTTDPARLAEEIDAVNETGFDFRPNYNVAPSADVAAVVARHSDDGPDDEVTRRIRSMRWGLLPPWVKAGPGGVPQTRTPMINARAETVTTSPAYRAAAAHKRCLIPMDGYYEWKAPRDLSADNPGKGRKTPFYFFRPDGRPLLVAGLWSVWKAADAARPLLSCTVITTDAVGDFAGVHDRMPLIVAEPDWDRWLDPDAPAPGDLLGAAPDVGPMAMREVTTLVNRVANNGPELIEAPGPGDQPVGLF